jgi:hypothetical protein
MATSSELALADDIIGKLSLLSQSDPPETSSESISSTSVLFAKLETISALVDEMCLVVG